MAEEEVMGPGGRFDGSVCVVSEPSAESHVRIVKWLLLETENTDNLVGCAKIQLVA